MQEDAGYTRYTRYRWKMLPVLISPAFALASDLCLEDLRAAAAMQLPPSMTLDQVWGVARATYVT